MRVVLANRYFYPDESATSRVVTSLARALVHDGYDVHVVTSRNLHNSSGHQLPAYGRLDGVHIHRVATTSFGRARLWSRAIDYASYHLSAVWHIRKCARRGDIVVICTDPPLLSATAMLPVRLAGARQVNWLLDLFPEVGIEAGVLPRRGMLTRLLVRLRNLSLSSAVANVAPMTSMADYLTEHGLPSKKITVIHNWSDGNSIYPIEPDENKVRREWELGRHFVVAYSGNLGRAHEFDTIIDAAALLRHRNDIKFLFIGGGARLSDVESRIRTLGLTNVMFKPLQPREQLSESLGVADVHLVSLLPKMEPFVIPSKFYGIAAAGRPTLFIGSPDGEIARVLAFASCGRTVRIGEPNALAHAICELADLPQQREAMGAAARQVFETTYDATHAIEAWRTLLARLAPRPSATLGAVGELDESAT